MAVRLTSDGERAVLLADVAVHPVLLDRLDVGYVFDVDPTAAVETRLALLVDCDVLVACGHYPGVGIGRLVTQSGRIVFVAV